MHNFSTAQNDFSLTLKHNQNDFDTGRLLCWSSALIVITLWGGVQFCHQQNLMWQSQHGYGEPVSRAEQNESPALPEATAIFRRITLHRIALHTSQRQMQNR